MTFGFSYNTDEHKINLALIPSLLFILYRETLKQKRRASIEALNKTTTNLAKSCTQQKKKFS